MSRQSEQADTVLYFAYGSNMSSKRLQARVPSATVFGRAVLRGHQLRFHKHSLVDNSAKCDAFETGNPDDLTHGVLFRFEGHEQGQLDMCEGEGYKITRVEVDTEEGTKLEALIYLASLIKPELSPFDWYLQHVLQGAREHALPPDYIAEIEAVRTKPDLDQSRRKKELAIYR